MHYWSEYYSFLSFYLSFDLTLKDTNRLVWPFQVYSQHYPVAIPCQQRGVPVAASAPVYIRASPCPPPAANLPCSSLPKASISPKQQLVPLEYAFTSPGVIPQALPVSLSSLAPSPCYPLPDPVPCAGKFILPSCPSCLNDICSPEPVFDIFGCLDPILSCCSIAEPVSVIAEIPPCPFSPFLPAASPASILPPILPSECSCHFLKKIAIPPPFI